MARVTQRRTRRSKAKPKKTQILTQVICVYNWSSVTTLMILVVVTTVNVTLLIDKIKLQKKKSIRYCSNQQTLSNFPLPSCSWSDESTELKEPDLDLESEPIECESMSLFSGALSLFLSEPSLLRGLGRGLIFGSLTAEADPVILKALYATKGIQFKSLFNFLFRMF